MSKITLLLQSLEDESTILKEVVEYYKATTEPNKPPTEDQKIQVYCQERLCELQTALENVERKLLSTQDVYQSIMSTYSEASKGEKKEMLAEIEELKQKINFRSLKQEAETVVMALKTRTREIQTQWEILQITRTPLGRNGPESRGDLDSGDAYEEIDPCGLLQSNRPLTQPQRTAHSGLDSHEQNPEQMVLSPASKIKYPQIKLPHFDGENDSWDEFWDAYSLIVDQNAKLGELEKILYLKDAIRGKAQNAIRSILMKASNCSLIVDVLHKKYGNKGNNRSQIVQRLLALTAANRRRKMCRNPRKGQ